MDARHIILLVNCPKRLKFRPCTLNRIIQTPFQINLTFHVYLLKSLNMGSGKPIREEEYIFYIV